VARVSTAGGVRVFPVLLGLIGCHVHSMGYNGLVFGEAQPQPLPQTLMNIVWTILPFLQFLHINAKKVNRGLASLD
jgi:hypothetical protein